MDEQKIIDLLSECATKKFWGSLRFIIQDGIVSHIQVEQTIKQKAQEMLIVREDKT